MNEFWNLDPIYKGFDDPRFEEDLSALKSKVEEVSAFAASLEQQEPLEGLRRGIAYREKISYLANKLGLYASLRQEADSRDTAAASQLGRVMALYSTVAAPFAAFKDWASKLPNLMELVMADEKLKNYEFMFRNILNDYADVVDVTEFIKGNHNQKKEECTC